MVTGAPILGASNRYRKTIHIYIDNSNLWIQGQKTYAEKKRLEVAYDPTWRFDVGRLKHILTKNSNLRGHVRDFEVKVYLYGSTPPPVDTVWRALESHDVEVSTFARSSWNGREKQIDTEMAVQSARQSYGDSISGKESEFVMVSGDRDLYSAVSAIVKDGFPVHVWSWSNCLASEYQRERHELIQVYLLDRHLEEIGFRETTFRVDRNTISPHSIVVLEPLRRASEIDSFVLGLSIPVYRYECPTQREDAASKDLVIIPSFAHSMAHKDLVNLFTSCKSKLEAFGLSVMTYAEYRQRYFQDSQTHELAISNRFAELPDREIPDQHDEKQKGDENRDHKTRMSDDKLENIDTNDGFTEVNRASEQWKKKLKKDEQKTQQHCYWGFYCPQGVKCKRGHTKNEEQHFKAWGNKTATKYKLCQNQNCLYGKKCRFAHGEAELLCTACDSTGHGRERCPTWVLRQ